ncbi:MAG: sulfotransferase family protein [Verrucomicrobiota bacterium]
MRDFITVVSGLPRSGTSLMMQMLAAGGVPPLTDELRVADESNPRGYLEFDPVKRLRSDHSWLDQARGKSVKIIHLLLPELPVGGAYTYRVVFMQRPIEEVLASQRTMLARQGKIAGNDAVLARVYSSQLEQTEKWLASHAEFTRLPLSYHSVLKNPAAAAQEINDFLEGELDVFAMAAAVDPALHRERKGIS